MLSPLLDYKLDRPNKRLLLITLCIGFFMVILDVNVVNVALPTILHDLEGDVFWLQWVVDGYTLTFACLLLTAGSVGDQVGARKIYLVGLLLFALTSLACGLATGFLSLTLFRLMQGASAALLVPTSLSLIHASFENPQERTTAIGIWAGVAGVAAAAGPVLGAFLTAWYGWRAVFLINVPLGIIGIGLALNYISPATQKQTCHIDFLGLITGIVSIAALAFALIEAGRSGWQAHVIASILLFSLMFTAFLLIEKYTRTPMIPLSFFSSSNFSTSVLVGMIINVCGYGILFLLPLYFQKVMAYSIFFTGLAITPFCALAAVGSYFSGKLTGMIGSKLVMMSGLMITASGFFMLLLAGEHTPYILLLIPIALIGVGGSITMPSATIAIINTVPKERSGIAAGIFNTSRQIGSLLGVAIFGALINSSDNFVDGMHLTLWIAGLLSMLGCLATSKWIRL